MQLVLTDLSKSSDHKKNDNYDPYRMSKIQHLRETETQRRFHFTIWLVISHEDNREILNYIL